MNANGILIGMLKRAGNATLFGDYKNYGTKFAPTMKNGLRIKYTKGYMAMNGVMDAPHADIFIRDGVGYCFNILNMSEMFRDDSK